MELFQAKDDYILQSGDRALWCSRRDGTMTVRPGTYVTGRQLSLLQPAIYLKLTFDHITHQTQIKAMFLLACLKLTDIILTLLMLSPCT